MGILAECPYCHTKQGAKKKVCKCGRSMDKAKKAKKVKYWISYRLPNGKIRRESVDAIKDLNGYSIEHARDAFAKRRVQKRENRVMEMIPESKWNFQDLSDWYLGLAAVKKLTSYDRIEQSLKMFNSVFGSWQLDNIRQTDLEEYQINRKNQGRADATIDMEIGIAQTAVIKAFDNDKIGGHALKPFRRTKKLLKAGANARKTLVAIEQYNKLLEVATPHYRAVLTIAFNTGMRLGEIKNLKWGYYDREAMMFRLPAEITKENRDKSIPVNHHVSKALKGLPRAIKHDYIITYRGEPLNAKFSLKKQFSDTSRKAEIVSGRKEGITFHDIRRTVKTNMLRAGIDKVYRDTILGHSLKGMDVNYIVPTDNTLTKAMAQYTEWLDCKLEPEDGNQKTVTKTG